MADCRVEKTPKALRLRSGQAMVGRYAFEGDEERVSQERKVPDRLKHRVSGAWGS